MKIGILTYHRARNYGAYMQAYALTAFLNARGYDSEIIDFDMKKAQKRYLKEMLVQKSIGKIRTNIALERTFKKARKNLTLSQESLVSDNMQEFVNFVKNRYDCIVVGSDEVWRIESFRGMDTPYWLNSKMDCIKVSYAASSRSDMESITEKEKNFLKSALNEFRLVSVRDSYTYQQISSLCDKNKMFLCCDPTFLYDFKSSAQNGKKILKERCGIDETKPTILIMSNRSEVVNGIREKYTGKANLVGLFYYQKGIKNIGNIAPMEWADVISAGDLLVTTYFHGMCFAIKGNTNFIAVEARKEIDKAGKMYDLLERENLLSKFIRKKDSGFESRLLELIEENLNKNEDFTNVVMNERKLSSQYWEQFDKLLEQTNEV